MILRRVSRFLQEVLHFLPLPGRSPKEWNEIESLIPSKPVVVLVSGFGASQRTLTVIRKRLMRDGYNVLILPLDWASLSDGVRGLYVMAEKLSNVILNLRKKKEFRKQKVFLVAHSAGGLVARYYIQRLGGSHYCDGLVTLATPHSGTWLAAVGLVTHLILKARCLLQMTPKSSFIKSLNHSQFPADFRMVSIFSKDDIFCPLSSTQLPQSLHVLDTVKSINLPRLSHSDFLMAKKPYDIIKRYLNSEMGTLEVADAHSA